MSTLATAKFDDSDEEDALDGDYKPAEGSTKRKKPSRSKSRPTKPKNSKTTGEGDDGGSSDSATDSGSSDSDEGSAGDRDEFRDERNQLLVEAKAAEAKARAERAKDLFASMQNDVGAQSSAAGSSNGAAASNVLEKRGEEEMIEIKRPRKFAGEVIYETVKVPRSDPEAIAYLASLSQPPDAASTITTDGTSSTPLPAASAATDPPKPLAKGGPPRKKPRQSLEAMAAGLGKAKKMTTLEKSQMDWKSHLSTSTAEANELETHRRSGGYLEKRDFLDRVGDRRAESFDQNRRK